ncbi:MAG: TRAP transporter substrate-binding protein DctP [Oscillospiraceae bacterium]|nr:TRAP transporter substrate-binding protein DctP [Oscillospiraceae bacterium]
MKRPICFILVIVLTLTFLSACAGGGNNVASTPPPAQNTTQPATPPPPPEQAEGWDFSDATNVNLAFAIYIPENDATTQDLCRYLDLVKEYTEGTVDYTLYAAQTLCNGNEELDAVKNGLADITFFYVAMGSGALPIGYILEYPAIPYNNDKSASYTFTDWFNQLKPAELDDFKFLFSIGQGNGGYITTSPIRTFEDFSGKQIRCGAAQALTMTAYGAIPVVLVIAEVYEALRTGVIDASSGMLHGARAFNLYEVTQYATPDPFYISSYLVVMNKDVWNSLTFDQQDAMEKATDYAFDLYLAPARYDDGIAAVKVFEENGLEIIRLDDKALSTMKDINETVLGEYASTVPGGPEAVALLKELAAKYNGIF